VKSALLCFSLLALGCGPAPNADPVVEVGLLLSYSGPLAANSINSERALLMAIQAANQAGGVGGRRIHVLARDTGSDPRKVTRPAQELLAAGAAVVIGPDDTSLAVQLKGLLAERTLVLPSFTTSEADIYKPHAWFVMGAAPVRVACELAAQLQVDGRQRPLVVFDPRGYNNLLGRELGFRYGFLQAFLPSEQFSTEMDVRPITSVDADSYVLATAPASASSLMYTLAAVGKLGDPARWYLSPTLHTPAFLETIPTGLLDGAHGVATGTVAGAADFRARFTARWHDQALDDAYSFYDAGAIVALALQRAISREGAVPSGTGLGRHIIGVTHAGGTPVRWDELDRGLELLRQGQEVGYVGLSGLLEFDVTGQSRSANTNWWTISGGRFTDVASHSACR
jgi:ABC-type branched-subunit amino acid transport system substrate-binding protein